MSMLVRLYTFQTCDLFAYLDDYKAPAAPEPVPVFQDLSQTRPLLNMEAANMQVHQ
jgi:hypothetical protein